MRAPPKANSERRSSHKKSFARALRTNATGAERKLWSLLRRKRLHPFRFRRQQPIGPYIADFFCAQARLIVELDGDQHGFSENRLYDAERTEFLNAGGYEVLRFANADVLKAPDDVLEAIWRAASQRAPLPETAPAVSTLPQGEGGG